MDPAEIRALFSRTREQGHRALGEPEGKAVLGAFGIDVPRSRVVRTGDEVHRAVAALAGPLALKVVCPAVIHKSDVGGVAVGLSGAAQVDEAIAKMKDRLTAHGIDADTWLIEEMAPRGLEMVVGGVIDPDFGPMVMTGLGGVFVEVLRDVSFRICPIGSRDAREMLEELRAAPLLRGVRGMPPASIDAIVDVLMRLGGDGGILMRCSGEISEVDVNPLIVTTDRAVAVDARFILQR